MLWVLHGAVTGEKMETGKTRREEETYDQSEEGLPPQYILQPGNTFYCYHFEGALVAGG